MCQGFDSSGAPVWRHRKSINDKFPRRGINHRGKSFPRKSTILSAWRIDVVYARRTLRNIVLRNTLGLAVRTLIASRSVGAEYDCFIIRSSSRTWKSSASFFPPSFFILFPLFRLLFRFCDFDHISYIITLLIPDSSEVRRFRSYDFYPVNNVDFSMMSSPIMDSDR